MSRQQPQRPLDDRIRAPGQGLRRPADHVNLHQQRRSDDKFVDEKGRESGMDGVGFGMMLAGDDSDDDDDDDDDDNNNRMPARPPPAQTNRTPPRNNNGPPGLVNPPAPVMSPPPPGPISRPTQALQPSPQPAQPRAAFMPPQGGNGGQRGQAHQHPPPMLRTSPGNEPHPLQSPSTPIVAKFAANKNDGQNNRTTVFGDEFWTRFNKAAHQDEKQPQKGGRASFLREYGSGRMSKWVWCCSIGLLVLIAGGVVAGWYFSRNDPTTTPQVFGGGANENSLQSSNQTPTPFKTTSDAPARTPPPSNSDRRRHNHHRRRLEIESLD